MTIIRTSISIGVSLFAASTAFADPYSFEVIADTSGQFSEFGDEPSINCSGTAAFAAVSDEIAGVYAHHGQTLTVIHETVSRDADYAAPSINDAGMVAFLHKPASRTQGAADLIAGNGTSSQVLAGGEDQRAEPPSINNLGQVAYSGRHDQSGVFVNDGGHIVQIATSGGTITGAINARVSLNDQGDVAFSTRIGGRTPAIVVGDGANLRVIAEGSGELTSFYPPAINNAGQVIFYAARPIDPNDRRRYEPVIAMSDGRRTHIVADSSEDLFLSGQAVAINNHGNYVFSAMVRGSDDEGPGIYVGPDSTADKVISPGDSVAGRTVKAARLGWSAINDAGQIVFKAEFADGTQAIVVADPAKATETDCDAPPPKTLRVSTATEEDTFNLQSAVRPSQWIETEKSRYREMLSAGRYDALIVPFQPDGHTLDATGRTMLARILADELGDATGIQVADPGIVEKAFGQPARVIDINDVFAFGRNLGVKLIVLGRVSHDRQYRMSVAMDAYQDRPGNVTRLSDHVSKEWRDVTFTDERLPMMVFEPMAAELTAIINGAAVAGPGSKRFYRIDDWSVPMTWAELESRSRSSPIQAALQLEFLAGLFPAGNLSRPREHLYERALIALRDVDPASSGSRLLRARAFMGLHRRPAALAALGKPTTSAEHAFLAYLNADLPSLEQYSAQIDDPILRVLADIDLQTVRAAYRRPSGFDRIDEIMEQYPAWYGFIAQRVSDNTAGTLQSHILTRIGLDSVGPAGNITVEEFLNARRVAGNYPDQRDLVAAIQNHVTSSYKLNDAAEVMGQGRGNIPRVDDLLQLALDLNVANVIAEAREESDVQGRPERGLEILAKYDAILADHPLIVLEKADDLRYSDQRRGRDPSFVRYLSEAFVWLGAQTRLDMPILYSPSIFFPELQDGSRENRQIALYQFDFPGNPDMALRVPDVNVAAVREWQNCYRYALFRVECAGNLHAALSTGSKADLRAADEVLEELGHRYLGHPDRLKILAAISRDSGEPGGEEQLLKSAIQAGSTDWYPYETLGIKQMREGRYADSGTTFLSYPAFRDTTLGNHIVLSNRAYNVGSLLYWAGRYEEARPLYEFSAGLATGSEASLSSAVRLSILEGDLVTATDITLRRVRRYESKYAYRDYMALLHLQGHSDEAWTLFDMLMQDGNSYGPQLWTAAYLGHRINGATDQEIIDWAMDPRHTYVAQSRSHELPIRYVFLMNLIDRLPPEDLDATLRKIDLDAPNPGLQGALRYEDEFTGLQTNFSQENQRTFLAARGLAHFHRGNLEEALESLDQIGPSWKLQEFLPYYAWCAVKTRRTDRLDKILSAAPEIIDEKELERHTDYQFDFYLTEALIAGAAAHHDDALASLRLALNHRPFTESRKIFTYYQILEIAEILYEDSEEDAYKRFGFNLARRFAVIQPMYPWAYSFAARFADTAEQRIPYLATALKLDPHSWRAGRSSSQELDLARRWLAKHGPLYERRKAERDAI